MKANNEILKKKEYLSVVALWLVFPKPIHRSDSDKEKIRYKN